MQDLRVPGVFLISKAPISIQNIGNSFILSHAAGLKYKSKIIEHFNWLRPSGAYMRPWTEYQWLR